MSLLRPCDRVSVIDRTITLAEQWQQVTIDQIRPMNETTSLDCTAVGSNAAADDSFRIVDRMLAASEPRTH